MMNRQREQWYEKYAYRRPADYPPQPVVTLVLVFRQQQ